MLTNTTDSTAAMPRVNAVLASDNTVRRLNPCARNSDTTMIMPAPMSVTVSGSTPAMMFGTMNLAMTNMLKARPRMDITPCRRPKNAASKKNAARISATGTSRYRSET